MRFPTLKIAGFLIAVASAASPLLTHAQLSASLIGSSSVGVGTGISVSASSSSSVTGNVGAGGSAQPVVVTAASARADLNAAATSTSAGTVAVSNQDSLKMKANLLATEDARVSSVTLSSQNVAVTYHEPARLFGFIGVSVPVTVSADASGAVRVNYPWYSFLFSTDQPGLTIRAKAAVENALAPNAAASAHANAEISLTLAEQAALLDSIHAVLADNAEASGTARALVQ